MNGVRDPQWQALEERILAWDERIRNRERAMQVLDERMRDLQQQLTVLRRRLALGTGVMQSMKPAPEPNLP
jgi:hypothetical protein